MVFFMIRQYVSFPIWKKRSSFYKTTSLCRGDRIRTCGRLVPNQERYRAALHPVAKHNRQQVGATGFEPAAAWSQTRSATGLRYTPQ